MTDDQLELVTAYVDGEATIEERALVEADAELLAEVERQQAIRAELPDVEPPTAAARESAIAAALAVFDDEIASTARAATSAVPSTLDVTAPTNIVPFDQRRRMRWMQGLGAAAAVAAVVVAGAVIATRGGDDDGTTAVEMRDSTPIELDSESAEQGETAEQPPAAAEVATTSADELMIAEATTDDADTAAAADEATGTEPAVAAPAAPVPAAPVPATTVPAAAAAAPATGAATLIVITTEDDLLEFADTMKTTPLDADDAESECSVGALKAEAAFEDEDGATHPIVVVAVDDDTIGALTLDDCDVALEADL